MPELPEVQTVVSSLAPRLIGRTIRRIQLLRTDIVTPTTADIPALLTKRKIIALTRRGKRIVFTLDDDNCFYIHLGMTGQLTLESPDRTRRDHTHLILSFDRAQPLELRFRDPRRFGGLFWLGCDSIGDEKMGPEPLTMTPSDLAANLTRTTRPIKNALMDQAVVAGLGNIYVDESLHSANLHPLIPANTLAPAQIKILTLSIKSILKRAIKARGSTLRDYMDGNGRLGTAQNLLQVYGREHKPCFTCQTPIERIVLGGRSTHFCPKCQPR